MAGRWGSLPQRRRLLCGRTLATGGVQRRKSWKEGSPHSQGAVNVLVRSLRERPVDLWSAFVMLLLLYIAHFDQSLRLLVPVQIG